MYTGVNVVHVVFAPGVELLAIDSVSRALDRLPRDSLLVVNKIDRAAPTEIAEQLARAAEFDFAEYFPVSATTGAGVSELVEAIIARMPDGPRYYPEGTVTDVPEAFWVAELVRE